MAVNMPSTYSTKLSILDVSAVLHSVTKMAAKTKGMYAATVKGVPTVGVEHVFNFCAQNYRINRRTVLCLDTYSSKRATNPEYKSNRKYDPIIAAQSDIIAYFFPYFGVDVLQKPGKEADELIYSVVYDNISTFGEINIITGDKDIYGALIAPHVKIIGSNSTSPTLNFSNYTDVITSEIPVPYNMILPYIVLYGKPSNTLNKLALGGKNQEYFNKLVEMSEDNPAMGSDISLWLRFLNSNTLPEDHFNKIVHRIELVYPAMVDCPISTTASQIDFERLVTFASNFNYYKGAEIYGIRNRVTNTVMSAEVSTFMKNLYVKMNNGTLSTDNGLRPDTLPAEIYASNDDPDDTTDEFVEVSEW